MEKSSFISNFKKYPLAFLSSVLLVIASMSIIANTEAFWRFCYFYSNPISDDGIRLEAQLMTISNVDNKKKIFLIGSSQIREGLDAKSLSRTFDRYKVMFYNLGISGAGQPLEMLMLKDELLNKKPDVIIYMPFVGSFFRSKSDYEFSKMKYYFNPKIFPYMLEYFGMNNIIDHKSAFLDSILGKFSIFYKYRESLRRIFDRAVRSCLRKEKKMESEQHGYKENKPRSYFLEKIEEFKGTKYKNTPATKLEKDLFTLFAKDVTSKGIKLIVIDGPTHPLHKKISSEEIETNYNNFLFDQAKNIGFIYVSKDQLPLFMEQDFIDFLHLNAKGRDKFTKFLKKYLLEEQLIVKRPSS